MVSKKPQFDYGDEVAVHDKSGSSRHAALGVVCGIWFNNDDDEVLYTVEFSDGTSKECAEDMLTLLDGNQAK